MAQNDFLPFATAPGADVLDQAAYVALSAVSEGFSTGTAYSSQLNKVWRQSSFMAAVLASFVSQTLNSDVLDDGDLAGKTALLISALTAQSAQRPVFSSTNSSNNYSISPGLGINTLEDGLTLMFIPSATNTGPATLNVNGLGANAIIGPNGALQGNELVSGTRCHVVFLAGSQTWFIAYTNAGAQQVGTATQSGHAVNLGTAQGFFAPKAGNAAQAFAVAAATASSQAVTLAQAQNIAYPVGSVYLDTIGTQNPAQILGYGTWQEIGQGRVLVGLDPTQTEFNATGKTGGEKTHTLTTAEMPAHIHNVGMALASANASGGGNHPTYAQPGLTTTSSTGNSAPHNNLQPYLVVRMWTRTA